MSQSTGFPPPHGPHNSTPLPQSSPPRRSPAPWLVGAVAASVFAGGAAGFGGAALWDIANPDSPDSSASSTTAPQGDTTSGSTSSTQSAAPAAADGSVESVAKSVLPSVVQLEVSGPQGSGTGSGIVLTSDGRILTNNHVVEIAGQGGTIQVDFNDGSHAVGKVVGTDPLTDVAVVQAQGVSGLKAATLGSSDDLQVGQSVVAVGSPFGLDATVTSGIVSALDRPVDVGSDGQGNVTAYPAIQTDAAINPGNSGGPLVDSAGRVVGMDASIQSTSNGQGQSGSIGLGFAIPIDEITPIVDQIVKGETPTHARLGVSLQQASMQQPGAQVADGATLAQVTAGQAAADAGLRAGDVVTKIDDHQIADADGLIAMVRSYRPGDTVTVTYTRGGSEHTADITLGSDAQTTTN